jgi:hypothetical protein
MRRDLALCLAVLEFCEEKNDEGLATVTLENVERGVVSAHVLMLKDAGLIDAERSNSGIAGSSWQVRRLTWAGHDWLDAHRAKRTSKSNRFVAVKTEAPPEPVPALYKAMAVRRVSSRSGAGAWEQPE